MGSKKEKANSPIHKDRAEWDYGKMDCASVGWMKRNHLDEALFLYKKNDLDLIIRIIKLNYKINLYLYLEIK